jgi:hypothetical protein
MANCDGGSKSQPATPEGELFAQEEILGCERAFGSQIENQEVQQIGQQLQPKYAGFYHGPMVPRFRHADSFLRSTVPRTRLERWRDNLDVARLKTMPKRWQ